MKTISLLMLALFCASAGAQTTTYQYSCKTGSDDCPVPPVPPVPPMPPMPPAPPAPPAVPPMPAVPAGAHAACAGKSAGMALTWVIRDGETMGGSCEKDGSAMRFKLRSYSVKN